MSGGVKNVQTLYERWKQAALNRWWIAAIILVAATVVATNQFADAADALAVRLGLRPSGLVLAGQGAKEEFSRGLTHRAYVRMFWANSYAGRLARSARSDDVNRAWDEYMAAVADWSAELVNTRMQLSKYYGEVAVHEFNDCIDRGLKDAHEHLLNVRYLPPDEIQVRAESLRVTTSSIDAVNTLVNAFATGLQDSIKRKRGQMTAHDSTIYSRCGLTNAATDGA